MMMFVLGGLLLSALLSDWLDELLKDNKKNKDYEYNDQEHFN